MGAPKLLDVPVALATEEFPATDVTPAEPPRSNLPTPVSLEILRLKGFSLATASEMRVLATF